MAKRLLLDSLCLHCKNSWAFVGCLEDGDGRTWHRGLREGEHEDCRNSVGKLDFIIIEQDDDDGDEDDFTILNIYVDL